MYIFNGKMASQGLKSYAFLKGFELEKLILGNGNVLPIFFGGGVIRGKKLQKGSVIQLTLEDEEAIDTETKKMIEDIGILKEIFQTTNQSHIVNILKASSTPLLLISNPEKKVTSPPSLPPISSLKIKPPMLNLALKPL